VPSQYHRSSRWPYPVAPSALAIQSAVWMASYRCPSALLACSRFLLLRLSL
jgi:hypothetical protein